MPMTVGDLRRGLRAIVEENLEADEGRIWCRVCEKDDVTDDHAPECPIGKLDDLLRRARAIPGDTDGNQPMSGVWGDQPHAEEKPVDERPVEVPEMRRLDQQHEVTPLPSIAALVAQWRAKADKERALYAAEERAGNDKWMAVNYYVAEALTTCASELEALLSALPASEPDKHRDHYRSGYSAGHWDGSHGKPMQDALRCAQFFGPEIHERCGGLGCEACGGSGETPLPALAASGTWDGICNFMRYERRQEQPCQALYPDDQTQWCGRCLLRAWNHRTPPETR